MKWMDLNFNWKEVQGTFNAAHSVDIMQSLEGMYHQDMIQVLHNIVRTLQRSMLKCVQSPASSMKGTAGQASAGKQFWRRRAGKQKHRGASAC
jgi:hypothetical protein